MRTLPRRFRPHTIVLNISIPENEDGIAEEKHISIYYTKVDTSYGIQQSKKGITTDDKIIIYIEINDLVAVCDDKRYNYNTSNVEYSFSIQPGKDTVSFLNETYVITAVNEIRLNADIPERLEIIAK